MREDSDRGGHTPAGPEYILRSADELVRVQLLRENLRQFLLFRVAVARKDVCGQQRLASERLSGGG